MKKKELIDFCEHYEIKVKKNYYKDFLIDIIFYEYFNVHYWYFYDKFDFNNNGFIDYSDILEMLSMQPTIEEFGLYEEK